MQPSRTRRKKKDMIVTKFGTYNKRVIQSLEKLNDQPQCRKWNQHDFIEPLKKLKLVAPKISIIGGTSET